MGIHHLQDAVQVKQSPVRLGFKLFKKVLGVTSINVMLSDAVVHESTLGAVEFYCDKNLPWAGTLNFMKLHQCYFYYYCSI